MVRNVCRHAGAVVVAVDDRLAPEHPFPAAADDAVAAARWLAQHLDSFGGDDRLGVAGDSAGGDRAAGVAPVLRDDGTPLAAQFLIYPSVDTEGEYPSRVGNAKGYFLEQDTMEGSSATTPGPERTPRTRGCRRCTTPTSPACRRRSSPPSTTRCATRARPTAGRWRPRASPRTCCATTA